MDTLESIALPVRTGAPVSTGFTAGLARVIADYVHAQGKNEGPVLRLLGLPRQESGDTLHDRRVPASLMSQALHWAAEALGDDHVGLRVASLVRPSHFGPLGYAMMSCTSCKEALSLQMRLESLLMTEIRGHYEMRGDNMHVHYEPLAPLPLDYLFWSFFVTSQLAFARWVSGRHIVPLSLELPCPAPADTRPISDFVGRPVRFGAPACAKVIPGDVLKMANPNVQPAIRDLMAGMAGQQWRTEHADNDRLQAQVHQAIMRALDRGASPTLQHVTAEMVRAGQAAAGLTSRLLQRRLAAQDTHFKEMVTQARRERALTQLRTTDLPLAQIAAEAGYAEKSSFHRAVRRWTGMTPQDIRSSGRGTA